MNIELKSEKSPKSRTHRPRIKSRLAENPKTPDTTWLANAICALIAVRVRSVSPSSLRIFEKAAISPYFLVEVGFLLEQNEREMDIETAGYRSWDEDSVFPSVDAPFFLDHVSRYYHARNFFKPGASVLDVACGKGYGSAILAENAGEVLGIDLNEESLALARKHFGVPNLEFRSWDVLKLAELGRKFDVITAFEIIEHLEARDTHRFLTALGAGLKPGGGLLLSTPNHDVVTKAGVEVPPFHINNLKATELVRLLKRHFPGVRMYGQYRKRGAIQDLAFNLDVFSWRHRVRRVSRAFRQVRRSTGIESGSPRIWSLGQTPVEVADYRFSSWAWRQAGLTFAVCSNLSE